MILDLGDLGQMPEADVCIAGSGPAGLTLGLALARAGVRVLVLEGGGEEYSDESQEMYRGEVVGHRYFGLDFARLRFLGGTSNHWGGWSRPLDAVDFEEKPWLPHAHWPIRRADLEPYLPAACAVLDIPAAFDDVAVGPDIDHIRFQFSRPPTRHAEKFRPEIEASDRLAVVLNASVTGVEMAGGQAVGFEVSGFDGSRRVVRAARLVMACGGIETNRLMLHFNDRAGGALVREPRTLGRYWMEHPHFAVGAAGFFGDIEAQQYFSPSAARLRRDQVLNCGLRVWTWRGEPSFRVTRELYCVAPRFAQEWMAQQQILGPMRCSSVLRAAWEQEPRAENRVALDASVRDRFGIPQPVLHWNFSEVDRRTAIAAVVAFGEHVARANLGRVRVADWLLQGAPFPEDDEIAGYHHMGGTRMADDPRWGVVDRDCRVWGQERMYIAGSSVFPTGGHANPTLTITQLSLRLAEHLAAGLKG